LGTPSGKRKSSPNPSGAVAGGGPSNPPRKKKKSSNTPTPGPEDIPPFPGIITKEEILAWFRRQPPLVPMGNAIAAFRQRIIDGGERQADNQRLFLVWVGRLTTTEEGKKLRLKEEYR
jgi:transcription initiation factor TFIIF subunit alpha